MIASQSPLVMFGIYVGLFLGILLIYDGIRQLLSRTERALLHGSDNSRKPPLPVIQAMRFV